MKKATLSYGIIAVSALMLCPTGIAAYAQEEGEEEERYYYLSSSQSEGRTQQLRGSPRPARAGGKLVVAAINN